MYYDCDGNCLADADGDGVCDDGSCCIDESACNHDEDVPFTMVLAYPDIYYDCDGNCQLT